MLDHKDTNGLNNKYTNLRYATKSENAQNMRNARSNSKAGLLGVTKRKTCFHARITLDGITYPLGNYLTAEEAHAAYMSAKSKMHPFAIADNQASASELAR